MRFFSFLVFSSAKSSTLRVYGGRYCLLTLSNRAARIARLPFRRFAIFSKRTRYPVTLAQATGLLQTASVRSRRWLKGGGPKGGGETTERAKGLLQLFRRDVLQAARPFSKFMGQFVRHGKRLRFHIRVNFALRAIQTLFRRSRVFFPIFK